MLKKKGVGLFRKQKSISYSRIRRLLLSPRIRLSHGQGSLEGLLCRNITVLASLSAEKRWWAFFEEKSISGAILGSAKIFTFLASFNAEKKSVGLFEKVH